MQKLALFTNPSTSATGWSGSTAQEGPLRGNGLAGYDSCHGSFSLLGLINHNMSIRGQVGEMLFPSRRPTDGHLLGVGGIAEAKVEHAGELGGETVERIQLADQGLPSCHHRQACAN